MNPAPMGPTTSLTKPVEIRPTPLRTSLGILTLLHLLVDVHSGMLPVILLYQRQELGLSLTQVGIAAGVYHFLISLAQPLFGHLADRRGGRGSAFGGLIWLSLMSASLGYSPTFSVMLVLAALAALGSAAFHPSGAAGASQLVSSRPGSGMSIFLVGGSAGYALGPLIATTVFEITGLRGTAWIGGASLALAITLSVGMWTRWPATAARPAPVAHVHRPGRKLVSSTLLGALAALLIVTGTRHWLYQSLANFVPQQLTSMGIARPQATLWLSAMLAVNIVGVLIGGPLADRYGHRVVVVGGLASLAPVLLVAGFANVYSIGPLVVLAGFLVGIPLAATIVVGQSLIPGGTGLASGLVLGISFAIGAAGVTLTGIIADQFGLGTAISGLAPVALAAVFTVFAIPRGISARQTRAMPPAPTIFE